MKKLMKSFANVRSIVTQAAVLFLLFAITLSCEKTEEPPSLSSETEILSITGEGIIDVWMEVDTDPQYLVGLTHSSITLVAITVTKGTDLVNFSPQFMLSPGATIVQTPGTDFSKIAYYLIIAEDGKTTSLVIAVAGQHEESSTTRATSTIHISSSEGGTTIPRGNYSHNIEHPLSIMSVPNGPQHILKAWNVNDVQRSTTPEFYGIVPAQARVHAIFGPAPAAVVTVESQNINMGTVSGGSSVVPGTIITIRATPISGYEFVGWYRDGIT